MSREKLLLRVTQLALELLLHVQQACRIRIQELESERDAVLQIFITPQALRSTLSTSTSIYVQPMVLLAAVSSVHTISDLLAPTRDKLLP